jgi:hypothetical protein
MYLRNKLGKNQRCRELIINRKEKSLNISNRMFCKTSKDDRNERKYSRTERKENMVERKRKR